MIVTAFRDLQNPVLAETGLVDAIHNEPVSCTNSLTDQLVEQAANLHLQDSSFPTVHSGVYAASLGPSLETPAELEMLRRVKCDVVGMSTVPELETVAMDTHHSTVACVSLISNDLPTPTQLPHLEKLLRSVLAV
jgi:purine-nucleoside phosphorylase